MLKRTPPPLRASPLTRAQYKMQQQSNVSPTLPQTSTSAVLNVETENTYGLLTDKDEFIDPNEIRKKSRKRSLSPITDATHLDKKSKNESLNPTNKLRPPPLTIPALTRLKANDFLSNVVDGNKFIIRLSNDGTKLFAPSIEAFNDAKSNLAAAGIKFYTHALRDEQTSKFVLNGFFKAEENEIIKFLNEVGVKPVKVKNIAIKNKRYDDHAVYVVHFLKRDKIKLSSLRETARIVNCIKVSWDYFKSRRNGPIQCTNCMKFGHGSALCFLNPICVRCGESHSSKNCPLIAGMSNITSVPRIPEEKLMCGNCGQNHPANYTKCEYRLEYIDRQIKLREKVQRKNNTNRPLISQPSQRQINFAPAAQLENAYFPSINAENVANGRACAWSQSQSHQQQQHELFSPPQLMTIMKDMIEMLRPCKTKEQQIFTLWEIVTKYVYGST